MSAADASDWTRANQRLLGAELARLRRRLEGDAGAPGPGQPPAPDAELEAARAAMPEPGALDIVAGLFGLSSFERELLLLCCGVELDSALAAACARALGNPARRNATLGLAMAALADAHWSALTPSGALRHWRMLELEPAPRLTDAALRVDERILHFVCGINVIDPRLRPLLGRHAPPELMADRHHELAAQIAAVFAADSDHDCLVCLDGEDTHGQRDVAAAVAAQLGWQLLTLHGEDLPAGAAELEQLRVLWTREARLLPALLLLEAGDAHAQAAARFVEELRAPCIVAARDVLRTRRAARTFSVHKPEPAHQKELWLKALDGDAARLDGAVDALAANFRLSAQGITAVVRSGEDPWLACRRMSRERLDHLAQRIEPVATWDDLVLPAAQKDALRQIAAHLRQRIRVYEDWGFAGRGRRGLGISALFSGESGTGKTLAAEVIASELAIDLYRIDLSTVVSKYIGETEKNLRRVFDAAEDSGAILLFDEADALFGKRSEVKDSHDRYANIEISYLLQRVELYRGLAILTTNMKNALDRAFQRRLRFIVNFPFPDTGLREEIWRRAFPAQAPVGGIDYTRLARLNLPGGNIRNIALNAAFLAADAEQPLGMQHLLLAAQAESAKLDRPLADAETRGWS
jgi:AAA+ superfamily predicted ATPase